MKAKLIIGNKEIEIEISEEQLKALESKQSKMTGYERVKENTYYIVGVTGEIENYLDNSDAFDTASYENANYYSDNAVAKNNTRADKLLRQLRRFAVEHREMELDWNDGRKVKFCIRFVHFENESQHSNLGYFEVDDRLITSDFGQIYFDTKETAQLAIETFKDELLWYFTEYKDSL